MTAPIGHAPAGATNRLHLIAGRRVAYGAIKDGSLRGESARKANAASLGGGQLMLCWLAGAGPLGPTTCTRIPALTSTSSSGIVLFGNVTPGLFTVAIDAPGAACDCCSHGMLTGWEWEGPSPGSFEAFTAADSMTDNLYMQCN